MQTFKCNNEKKWRLYFVIPNVQTYIKFSCVTKMLLALNVKRALGDEISVKIGEDCTSFATKDLKHLSFFDALLSSRWGKTSKQMNLTGNNFKCHDIQMLLLCGKLKHIPYDIKHFYLIDSLLRASDYLTTPADKYYNITEEMLTDYLKNKKPALTMTVMKKWLLVSKHQLFRQSLFKLHDRFKTEILDYQNKIFSIRNPYEIIETKTIDNLDEESAVLLFKKLFQIGTNQDANGKLTSIDINCQHFVDFKKVWEKIDFSKHWDIIGSLVNDAILACLKLDVFAWDSTDISYSDGQAILLLFESIIKYEPWLLPQNNVPALIDRFDLFIAAFLCAHTGYYTFDKLDDWLINTLNFKILTLNEKQKFLPYILSVYNRYVTDKHVHVCWCKVLVCVLESCTSKFLVENGKRWFPILYETLFCRIKYINLEEWCFKNIFEKLNTDLSFKMAMYLINYVVYDKPSNIQRLPDKIMNEIKRVTGTTWDVIYTAKRV